MSQIYKQNETALWFQPAYNGTPWELLGLGMSSASGRTVPGAQRNIVYGGDRYGLPAPIIETLDPPQGQPGATLGVYDTGAVPYFEKAMNRNCEIAMQIRGTKCGVLDSPTQWDWIDHHSGGRFTQRTLPDAPTTPFSGQAMQHQGTLVFRDIFRITRNNVSRLTTTETENLTGLAVLTDAQCDNCGNGYPGADKIMFATAQAATGVEANVIYSRVGGGAWGEVTAKPFAADEDIGGIAWQWAGQGRIRLIVWCATGDAAARPKLAYGEFRPGGEEDITWTTTLATDDAEADTADNDAVTAFMWESWSRLFVATTGGLVFLIENQANTWDAPAVADAGVDITAFASDWEGNTVYAGGASNALLRETNKTGVFATRVGPTGGGAFTALAVTRDGTLWAGNGTSIYRSSNGGENVEGWTLLKNFGTNKPVRAILRVGIDRSRGGDSEIIRVVVDNTAGSGELWQTIDGGSSWEQIDVPANSGYNAAVESRIDNNAWIMVGDANGGTGLIHSVTEKAI